MRRSFIFAVLTLLLLILCTGTAGAEKPDPATPTDLACTHQHIKTTIYFFDSPTYTPVSSDSHKVSGRATVETVCTDCGVLLSSETVNNAEEIRAHSMKKGVCALCGFRQATRAEERSSADTPEERTIFAQKDRNAGDLLTLTLSRTELTALEDANVSTVLIRGKDGSAAIALGVTDALTQTETTGADLYMELAEREDGSFFAGLYLISGPGGLRVPEEKGVTLRFYREGKTKVRVSVAPADSDMLVETESVWNERGYWSVKYLKEGTYFILQQ